ncbi:protein of unknown function DUF403 [Thalassoporum mexicanum PCC 7367]|uniref:alpha-E domain-containing protein n=1 Tax=Thalassoporum mexicanum TaxID=3457544 RepID=UPI00029FC2F4|nr:alpha-E domain-containing protein [Pseudanabaena sp. PCC 7367]AFY69912.1 protein of unknown function DUF403 [Pseudanabaena sp. PCC 7367]
MLSRVADSIYWLNRYIERAENVARFVDVNLKLMLDMPTNIVQQWDPLVAITGDLPTFQERYGDATARNVIHFLTFDREYHNSIITCLQAARQNARSVREIISSEMWEQINEFYLFVKDAPPDQSQAQIQDFFNQVKLYSHLFQGLMNATMAHNEGWHFGQMGRLIERADKTSRILDVKYFILLPSPEAVGSTIDEIQWMALLKSASAYEMYRKKAHRITPPGVAKFLLLDPEFPRSIYFSLLQMERSLHKITGTPMGNWSNSVERQVGQLRSELEFVLIDEIFQSGLHEFLDKLQQRLNGIGNSIYQDFCVLEAIA